MAVAGWQFVWRRALWCICERGRGLHTPPHQRSCPDILCRIKAGNYRSVFPEGQCLCEKLMTRVRADDSPVWYVSRRRGFMRGFLRMGCRAQYRQKRFCQLRCICSSCSAVSALPAPLYLLFHARSAAPAPHSFSVSRSAALNPALCSYVF